MFEPIIVGDIHGEISQLESLIKQIGPCTRPFIFLGDYINRGPDSKAVIDFLIRFTEDGNKTIFLCGNHEWALLEYLEHGEFDKFASLGGLRTLSSYLPEGQTGDLRDAMIERLPISHVRFFKRLLPFFENDTMVCSHSGVPQDRPDERNFRDLVLGTHLELFSKQHKGGKLNICGHYPQTNLKPFYKANFICLDTGCGTLPDGILTALFVPEMQYLQVDHTGKSQLKPAL